MGRGAWWIQSMGSQIILGETEAHGLREPHTWIMDPFRWNRLRIKSGRGH